MVLSERALDHVARPRNRGQILEADRKGVAGSPGDGPYVQIWLVTEHGKVVRAQYETNGCPSSVASASALCELAIGREMQRLNLLEAGDLIAYIGGLPEGKENYAAMAIDAMRAAIGESD